MILILLTYSLFSTKCEGEKINYYHKIKFENVRKITLSFLSYGVLFEEDDKKTQDFMFSIKKLSYINPIYKNLCAYLIFENEYDHRFYVHSDSVSLTEDIKYVTEVQGEGGANLIAMGIFNKFKNITVFADLGYLFGISREIWKTKFEAPVSIREAIDTINIKKFDNFTYNLGFEFKKGRFTVEGCYRDFENDFYLGASLNFDFLSLYGRYGKFDKIFSLSFPWFYNLTAGGGIRNWGNLECEERYLLFSFDYIFIDKKGGIILRIEPGERVYQNLKERFLRINITLSGKEG